MGPMSILETNSNINMSGLGRWAVIDIETTGIDANSDAVIDVGFLQFDGIKLVRKYSSLVRADFPISQFIQKLTGITQQMLSRARAWEEVQKDILDLEEHVLLAHNADFEKSFLQKSIASPVYADSLYYLALLHPGRKSLNLESFIIDYSLSEKEIHRGYEDSLDLLKVLLVSTYISYTLAERKIIESLFDQHQMGDFWFVKFFFLTQQQLCEIAEQIDFNLLDHVQSLQEVREVREVREEQEVQSCHSIEFSGANIEAILKNENRIKQILPQYRYREMQRDLALRVGQSFKNGSHAMIQAPTGTGKTIGYLIPSAFFSLQNEKKVLIATGTKILQSQVISKDVPQLRMISGLDKDDLKTKVLFGSKNHYCELLFRHETEGKTPSLLSSMADFETQFEERFAKIYFELVFFMNATQGKEILRPDVPYSLKRKSKFFFEMDENLAVDFRSCAGRNCPYCKGCSYIGALQEAKEADIIIGNHALMFSWPGGLERPGHIIVDEAHRLEHEATESFSLKCTQHDLFSLLRQIQTLHGPGPLFYILSLDANKSEMIIQLRQDILLSGQMLEDHLKQLPEAIERFFQKRPNYSSKFWNEVPMVTKNSTTEILSASIYNHFESIKNIVAELHIMLSPYLSLKSEKEAAVFARFENFVVQLQDVVLTLDTVLSEHADYVHSLKYSEEEGFKIEASPIDIGKYLHENLLKVTESVVMVSATLGAYSPDTAQTGIEWMSGYTYVPPNKRFKNCLYLPSPYNYEANAKVFLCNDVLKMNDPQFIPEIFKNVIPLIKNIGGRSLLLFSARSRFEIARELLLSKLGMEIPLFIQDMGAHVVEDYKKSPSGILLGMESFGEGIDIPGDALSFVFIDKIPDLRQDLIVEKRRDFFERTFGNEFHDYYLLGRCRSLHQKLGRLLRTENDRGGCIIVDSRIKSWKGKTIEQFTKLMSPYKIQSCELNVACKQLENFILTKS